MNTIKEKIIVAHINGSCASPDVRERLAVYITNPLTYSSAAEVEDHLLDCRECREVFMVMLRLRDEARRAKEMRGGEDQGTSHEAQVFKLADFRKEWP